MSAIKVDPNLGGRVIPANPARPDSFRWTRTGGGTVAQSYTGPYADLFVLGQSLSLEFDSVDIQRQGEGDIYKLTAAQNAPEVQETHEVVGVHMTQAKMYNKVVQSKLTAKGIADPKRILCDLLRICNKLKADQVKYAAAITEIEKVLEDYLSVDPGSVGSDLLALCVNIFKDVTLNGDQFLQVNFSYRHTFIYAERIFVDYDLSPAYADVQKFFTEDQLRTAESVPASFKFPKQVQDNTKTAFWLKQAPHVSLTYGQKRQVVVEYLFADEWSDLYYAAKT